METIVFPTQKRGGCTSVMGALDSLTNNISCKITTGRINGEFFCSFLEDLRSCYKHNELIHLVLDNARYHKSEEVIKKAEMLRISLIFLPPYCPNLNLIERLWKFMKKIIAKQKNENISQTNFLLSDFFHKFAKGYYKSETENLFNFNFQII